MFYPQSSSVDNVVHQNTTDTTTVVADPTRTTVFVENTKVIKSTWNGSTGKDNIEVKFNSIRDFLGKPYLVQSTLWQNSDTTNTILYNSGSLGAYLASVTPWAIKLTGFNLVRGTFKIRIEIIANRFQQGMGVIHYLPNVNDRSAEYGFMHNSTMNGILQQPHVLLNVSDSTAEISVPYIAPTSYYSITDSKYDWGNVWFRVLSPLNSGVGGETNCRFNVYAWIEDVELAAPMVPQADEEDTPGPISSGLMHISRAATSFARIPVFSSIGNSVSWVARMASGVASVFGWSKPTNGTQPVIVARQQWRYGTNSDGSDNSVSLGLIHDNKLDIKSFSIRGEDEMSTKFLYTVPNYMGAQTWAVGDTPGTIIWGTPVGPAWLGVQGTSVHNGHTATWVQGAPVFYLSNYFNFWRGSFRAKIKIIKTEMHKGKLQVTWTPSSTGISTIPSTTTSIYSLRHILDIAEKDTFELTLPYLINTDYLNCQNDGTNLNNYSGALAIKVLNELRCPETCAQSVQVLFWVEPGDDFEFAAPGRSLYPATTPVPFIPQASIEDTSDTLVSGGIGGSSIRSLSVDPSLQSMGEHFTSIKQLLNRFSQSFIRIGTSTSFANGVGIWPYYSGETTINTTTGAIVAPVAAGDLMSIFMPCYAYMRGGVRVGISPNQDVAIDTGPPQTYNRVVPGNIQVSLTPCSYSTHADGNTVIATYNSGVMGTRVGINPNVSVINVGSSVTEVDYGLGLVSATVPYYSRTPIALTAYAPEQARKQAYDSSKSVVNFVANTTAGVNLNRVSIYRSCCDDFQFNFFVGCPPVLLTYV